MAERMGVFNSTPILPQKGRNCRNDHARGDRRNSGLTEKEIKAIAEREHRAGELAAGMVEYLIQRHGGPQAINRMLCEDIRTALHNGDIIHARELYATLKHFIGTHPEAAQGPE